jgi:hypothetical protein
MSHFRIVTDGFLSQLRWFISRFLSHIDAGFAISVSLTRLLEVVIQEMFEELSTKLWVTSIHRIPTGPL